MLEFNHTLHRGVSFRSAYLVEASDPRLAIVIQPDKGRFLFCRVPGTTAVFGPLKDALLWAQEAGTALPPEVLPSSPEPKTLSPWRTLEPGETREIPVVLILARLFPGVTFRPNADQPETLVMTRE